MGGRKEGAPRTRRAEAAAHFPGHSIPKKQRRRRLQKSNLWSPPFPPSFLPNPIYLGSPISFSDSESLLVLDFISLSDYYLGGILHETGDEAAQTTRQQGGLLLSLPPLLSLARAPFGQVELRKGGGRRLRRNRWHLLSSAWSRARPQEVAWSRVRVRFLKCAHPDPKKAIIDSLYLYSCTTCRMILRSA